MQESQREGAPSCFASSTRMRYVDFFLGTISGFFLSLLVLIGSLPSDEAGLLLEEENGAARLLHASGVRLLLRACYLSYVSFSKPQYQKARNHEIAELREDFRDVDRKVIRVSLEDNAYIVNACVDTIK